MFWAGGLLGLGLGLGQTPLASAGANIPSGSYSPAHCPVSGRNYLYQYHAPNGWSSWHGDVCRGYNDQHGSWSCPTGVGCVQTSGAPYCKHPNTGDRCRTAQGYRKDCVKRRNVGTCNGFCGTLSTRTNYYSMTQPAEFGGSCDTSPQTENCWPTNCPSGSVQHVGEGAGCPPGIPHRYIPHGGGRRCFQHKNPWGGRSCNIQPWDDPVAHHRSDPQCVYTRVDCAWTGEWGAWGACNQHGQETRSRTQNAWNYNGSPCSGAAPTQSQYCTCQKWVTNNGCGSDKANPSAAYQQPGSAASATCCIPKTCQDWRNEGKYCSGSDKMVSNAASKNGFSSGTCCEPKTCAEWNTASAAAHPGPNRCENGDPATKLIAGPGTTNGYSSGTCCEAKTCQQWSGEVGCPADEKLMEQAGATSGYSKGTCCVAKSCEDWNSDNGGNGCSAPGTKLVPDAASVDGYSHGTCCEPKTCAEWAGEVGIPVDAKLVQAAGSPRRTAVSPDEAGMTVVAETDGDVRTLSGSVEEQEAGELELEELELEGLELEEQEAGELLSGSVIGYSKEVCCEPKTCQEWSSEVGCRDDSKLIQMAGTTDGYSHATCCIPKTCHNWNSDNGDNACPTSDPSKKLLPNPNQTDGYSHATCCVPKTCHNWNNDKGDNACPTSDPSKKLLPNPNQTDSYSHATCCVPKTCYNWNEDEGGNACPTSDPSKKLLPHPNQTDGYSHATCCIPKTCYNWNEDEGGNACPTSDPATKLLAYPNQTDGYSAATCCIPRTCGPDFFKDSDCLASQNSKKRTDEGYTQDTCCVDKMCQQWSEETAGCVTSAQETLIEAAATTAGYSHAQCCELPTWSSAATPYTGKDRVTYNGAVFEAQWWTKSEPSQKNTGPPGGSGKEWQCVCKFDGSFSDTYCPLGAHSSVRRGLKGSTPKGSGSLSRSTPIAGPSRRRSLATDSCDTLETLAERCICARDAEASNGGSIGSTPAEKCEGSIAAEGISPWSSTAAPYQGKQRVTHKGAVFEAQWYTKNEPSASNTGAVGGWGKEWQCVCEFDDSLGAHCPKASGGRRLNRIRGGTP